MQKPLKKSRRKKKRNGQKKNARREISNSGILTIRVKIINGAGIKVKRDTSGIVYYNCNKKNHISQTASNLRKTICSLGKLRVNDQS